MKFTLSWLKDHLDTDASVSDITDALTDRTSDAVGRDLSRRTVSAG